MKKHRIMLIGCGGMAKSHVARFPEDFERAEVTAVVDLVEERARAVSELLPNHPMIFRDYREGLELCDAVLQVLPHHLHAEVTIDCLNAGKHVLAEKPLANTEQECLSMIQAAQRNNRILMTAYCMRYHPLVRKLKELIQTQAYGKCFQLSIWTEQFTRYEENHWALKKETVGGGQLFSHGCHYIDLMLWMLGKPLSGTHTGSNYGTEWMEKEGTSNVCIAFESGAMGYHFGTWGARGSKLGYAFHAHCTKGMLELNFHKGCLYLHDELSAHIPGESDQERKPQILLEAPGAKSTLAEMEHFLDCIETGKPPFTGMQDSLEGLKVIWKLYEAEEKGVIADLRGLGFDSE